MYKGLSSLCEDSLLSQPHTKMSNSSLHLATADCSKLVSVEISSLGPNPTVQTLVLSAYFRWQVCCNQLYYSLALFSSVRDLSWWNLMSLRHQSFSMMW